MLCHGEPLRPFAESLLGGQLTENAKFIGRVVDGQPVAVAAIEHWCGWDCEVSIASTQGLSRDFIRAVFRYVFEQLGCRRCTGRVSASLPWAQQLERLGFREEGRLREAAPDGGDTIVFGMLRPECRWLESK